MSEYQTFTYCKNVLNLDFFLELQILLSVFEIYANDFNLMNNKISKKIFLKKSKKNSAIKNVK